MSMDRQERKRQEILSQIMGEAMVYDKMFSACMQNNRRAFEYLASNVLGRKVEFVAHHTQHEVGILGSHSVRYDCWDIEASGANCVIEMQRLESGFSLERWEFYDAVLALYSVSKGDSYEDALPERNIMVFCAFRVHSGGKTLYTLPAGDVWPNRKGVLHIVDMTVFDGMHPGIESAVKDTLQPDWRKIVNPDLREAMYSVKTSKEILSKMTDDELETWNKAEGEGYNKGFGQGFDNGFDRTMQAANMLISGESLESVSKETGFGIERVEEIASLFAR